MPEFIQSKQSVIVNGHGVFVVNNIRKRDYYSYPASKATMVAGLTLPFCVLPPAKIVKSEKTIRKSKNLRTFV